jgi:serine/threonine protein kinase
MLQWHKPLHVPSQKFELHVLEQIVGLAGALRHIHDKLSPHQASTPPHCGICAHNDIKPSNILVYFAPGQDLSQSIWRVSDFGMSTFCDSSFRGPSQVGTLLYRPPPAVAAAPLDPQLSDVFALGCVALEVLEWVILKVNARKGESLRHRLMRTTDLQVSLWYRSKEMYLLHQEVKSTLSELRNVLLEMDTIAWVGVLQIIGRGMLEIRQESRKSAAEALEELRDSLAGLKIVTADVFLDLMPVENKASALLLSRSQERNAASNSTKVWTQSSSTSPEYNKFAGDFWG